MLFTELTSPIGPLLLLAQERTDADQHTTGSDTAEIALTGLYFHPPPAGLPVPTARRADTAFQVARDQLEAYFAGQLQVFDLPLAARGTAFQTQVWTALRAVPFGTTTTYGALARQLGRPVGAARAVGACNGRNPIGIVVPCHRVIGSTGSIVGYAGGLDRKRWLLAHEARTVGRELTLFADIVA